MVPCRRQQAERPWLLGATREPTHVDFGKNPSMAAPWGWTNWRAFADGSDAQSRVEMTLYSDCRFVGEIRGLGPYSVLNTIGASTTPRPGLRAPALVLRVEYHTAIDSVLDPGEPKTLVDAYHGGWVDDELASLLGLALGARCRSGGLTRAWWGANSDPLGSPAEFEHRPPFLPPPEHERAPLLPNVAREVGLGAAHELLATYPKLSEKDASALVRAARLYQSALWIADGDPNLAWLQLVSALESAAIRGSRDRRRHYERLSEAWPELAEVLSRAPDRVRDNASKMLADQVRVTNRVIAFVRQHQPPPPSTRPSGWGRVDWDALPDLVHGVYRWRSRALHEGIPMPAPMCTPPSMIDDAPEEGAVSGGYGAAGASWTGSDIPLMLHTFAYAVRGSVLRWWQSRVSGRTPPALPA